MKIFILVICLALLAECHVVDEALKDAKPAVVAERAKQIASMKARGTFITESERSSALGQLMSGFALGLGEGVTFTIDPAECVDGLESIWYDIEDATYAVENGFTKSHIKTALSKLANAANGFVHALDNCGLVSLAEKIAEVAVEMDSGYGEIAETVKIICHGVDIYDDVTDIVNGYRERDYYEVGKSIGMLIAVFLPE